MVALQTQTVIKNFGVEKFGQSLFVPVAGKKEEELGVWRGVDLARRRQGVRAGLWL
ncbi:MAG TPA: hypothetical protein VE689_10730 [Candidatus Udaeobacter sp.]|nr:hypothetical protein [Candidatus Udaeobacter sp.]